MARSECSRAAENQVRALGGAAAVAVALLISAGCGSGDTTPTATGTSTSDATVPGTSAGPTIVPLCSEVAPLGPIREGNHPGTDSPPDDLQNAVAGYAAEHPDTYAGWWVDRDHGGTVVVAFTDDPAPHLAALLARSPQPDDPKVVMPVGNPPSTPPATTIGESGWTVDVVQARHTRAELDALGLRLYREGTASSIPSGGQGQDVERNRVLISLPSGDEATRRRLATTWPADALCVAEGPSPDATWPSKTVVASAIS